VPELAGGMRVVLKTANAPETVVAPLRQAIRTLDAEIPVAGVTTMAERLKVSLQEARFLAWLVGLFGALAAVVAGVGVYGLMSYSVTMRRAEMGLRQALGARPQEILSLVLREGLAIAAAGIAAGVLLTLAIAPAVNALFFNVRGSNPLVLAATAAAVVALTIVATWVPARRATRASPLAALRSE
jgi:ABC-type antimicrobial peptide transport system permease subunit